MIITLRLLLLIGLVISLNACVSTKGGFADIQDSGPSQPIDLSHVPDAVPRYEKRTIAGNKTPYTVLGKTYVVDMDVTSYRKRGVASWYGRKFHGRNTSNGEVYDMYGMTAAHKSLPIPSYVKVTNLENGKKIIVRVNDRGPFHGDRIIDLSYAAASKLGFHGKGTARVEVELINTDQTQMAEHSAPAANSSTFAVSDSQGSFSQPHNNQPIVAAHAPSQPIQRVATVQAPVASQPVNQTAAVQNESAQYVQAGAFSSEESAINFQQKLSSLLNYPVFVEGMDAVTRLFKVRIGPIINEIEFSSIKEIMSDHNLGVPYLVKE